MRLFEKNIEPIMAAVGFKRLYTGMNIDNMRWQCCHKHFQHRRSFVRKGIQQPTAFRSFFPYEAQFFKPVGNGANRATAKKAKGLGYECAIPIAANIQLRI